MVTKAYSPSPALWIHFGSLLGTVAKIWAFQVCALEVWVKGRSALSVRLCVIVSLIKQDKPGIYGSTFREIISFCLDRKFLLGIKCLKEKFQLGIVALFFNLSTGEAEAGRPLSSRTARDSVCVWGGCYSTVCFRSQPVRAGYPASSGSLRKAQCRVLFAVGKHPVLLGTEM